MKTIRFIIAPLLLPVVLLSSCKDPAEKMGKGFRLPDGKVELGKTAFLDLKCHQCHTVAGMTLPKHEAPSQIALELGGEVRKVKSYGELVTSIIQPQHVVAPEYLAKLEEDKRKGVVSPMPDFNDRMTVTQLTNLVTFLHSTYQQAPPPGMNYPYYLP
jgi:phage FluMu protein Com